MGVGWGWVIGFEVKRPGGKLDPKQEDWRADFLKAPRTFYQVVTSIDDVITAIEGMGKYQY